MSGPSPGSPAVDLSDVNDPHALAVAGVPAGAAVLEVGVTDGSLEAVLRRLGCRIWAIESDPVAAKAARESCQEVVVADVESLDLDTCFTRRFDVVLLLDALGQVKDPVALLRKVGGVVAPGGWVVVSLPNVTHGAVRLQLLHGRWSYTPIGLLGETNLRFYDRAGAEALLRDAGYSVFDCSRVVRPVDATEIPVDLHDQHPDVVAELSGDLDADTYRFVFYAAPDDSHAAGQPPLLPMRLLQERARHLEEEVRRLQMIQPDRQAWLLGELSALRVQSQERRRILHQLLIELRENTDRSYDEIVGLAPD